MNILWIDLSLSRLCYTFKLMLSNLPNATSFPENDFKQHNISLPKITINFRLVVHSNDY